MDSDDLQRLLVEHTDAWNSHDIDRLMSLFADDCVFEASGGPEFCGRRFEGRSQVMAAFMDVFDSMPDAKWGEGRHHVLSDGYGVSEWRLPARCSLAATSMSSAATSSPFEATGSSARTPSESNDLP